MKYTYDLNTNGCLILYADSKDQTNIREIIEMYGKTLRAESEVLQGMFANSELEWIAPEEIGALTSAPILGLRDDKGEPIAAWAFMDYQVRSFLTDLLENGKAIFIS